MNGFRDAGWTVSTVLAVDTSRSMKRYSGTVRAALPDFVAKLQKNDAVALITFDDDVHQGVPFGAPRDQLGARIQTLKTAGTRTVLHEALGESLDNARGTLGRSDQDDALWSSPMVWGEAPIIHPSPMTSSGEPSN